MSRAFKCDRCGTLAEGKSSTRLTPRGVDVGGELCEPCAASLKDWWAEDDDSVSDQIPLEEPTPDEESEPAEPIADTDDDDVDETPPSGDESDQDAVDEDPGHAPRTSTFTTRSYALVLTGWVAEFFEDTERVTVRERDGRYELAPGESEEWPDYAASEQIQVGNPGKDVLGIEADDDIRVREAGDVLVVEPPGQDPAVDDDTEQGDVDGDRFWCSSCAAGPFATEDDVRDHHDREDHPGAAIVKPQDPSELVNEDSAATESATDGGVAASQPDTAAAATCQNCGSHVTADYARVFAPDDEENPRMCPECEGKVRERDGTVRDARTGGQ